MTEHRTSCEPQPIADQWLVRCTCGWTSNVSLYDYERRAAEEAERRAAAHVGIECAWKCGKTEFACSTCGGRVPIAETVDIFHVGICERCGERTDESCRERTT